jgi:antitoxin FitA
MVRVRTPVGSPCYFWSSHVELAVERGGGSSPGGGWRLELRATLAAAELPVRNTPPRGARASSPSIALNGPGAIIDGIMAQLLVRNLDDELVQALRVRARSHGRSAEAEHREILRAAMLGNRSDFKAFLESMPGGDSDDDPDLERDRSLPRDVDL